MILPGIEISACSRRRSLHGRSAALMPPHVRQAKPNASASEELAAQDHEDGGLHSLAMAARRRLDTKLRAGGLLKSSGKRAEHSSVSKQVGASMMSSLLRLRCGAGSSSAMAATATSLPKAQRKDGNEKRKRRSEKNIEKLTKSNNAQEECPICLESFDNPEQMLMIHLPCSHTFHSTCLSPWLQAHSNCPICRASFLCYN